MKKIALSVIAAIAAITFNSCGNGTPSANIKNDIDSVSYTIGMAQSNGLKEYLAGNLGVDTAYMDQFIKGLNEGANAGDDKKKQAYMAGLQIGQQIANQMMPGINRELFGSDSTQTISMKNFIAGFVAGTTGKKQLMNVDQAAKKAEELMKRIKTENMAKQYGEYKAENEKWLATNAKKEGVKTLPSGVQYKVITEGSGDIPADTSMVVVDYEGKLIDGTVFDSSMKRGEPITFRANQVIKGWTEALCHMPVGSKWEVYIPAEMAYGEREQGQIKPFSTLVFTIDLKDIKK